MAGRLGLFVLLLISLCSVYRDSLGVDRGGAAVFAKPDEQERFSFNGSVIFEGQRDDMLVWFSKGYPLVLKDDIGSDLQHNLPTSLALPTLYEVRRLNQMQGSSASTAMGGRSEERRVGKEC